MVDYFSLALTHGLLALAAWRLLWRNDLDQEPADRAGPGDETPDDSANDPRLVLKRKGPVRRA